VRRFWWTVGVVSLAAAGLFFVAAAGADVSNGGFEKATLMPWKAPSHGSGEWFVYAGTATPLTGDEFYAPPEGTYGAVTDQEDPGAHVLYQKLKLRNGMTQLSFVLSYSNEAMSGGPVVVPLHNGYSRKLPSSCITDSPVTLEDACDEPLFCSPGTFEFRDNSLCNQQYRVDILRENANPYSLSSHDVLATLFQTQPGDPAQMPPTFMAFDLAGLNRTTVMLRFAEVDNQAQFHAGVDDVHIGAVG
jgi:hypothetical protein